MVAFEKPPRRANKTMIYMHGIFTDNLTSNTRPIKLNGVWLWLRFQYKCNTPVAIL